MDARLIVTDSLVEEIARTFAAASGHWRGCDWQTEFGRSRLDLNGLRRSQAILMARATAGAEAVDWRAAAAWLEQVEHDARQAESEAQAATRLAHNGQLHDALEHASRACAIEARYHKSLTWQPLRDAIEAALSQAENNNSNEQQPND